MPEFLNVYGKLLAILVSVGIFVVGYFLQSRARKIQSLLAWNQYRGPIKQFADDSIDTLTKIEGLCEVNPEIAGQEFWNKRNELISEISALRDKGKFIIPNEFPDSYGMHKSSAYRGFRHKALDCLAAGYYFAVALDFSKSANNRDKAMINELSSESPAQLLKIKAALEKLPESPAIMGFKGNGWSCKSGIVECKRQFVSIMQEMLEPRHWNEQIGSVSKT